MSKEQNRVSSSLSAEFSKVVDFHGCYCLDIAMGFRVAQALVRAMGDELSDMKAVVAYVGTETCAVDAIQKVTGCTLGKRNLYLMKTGKPVYILQNTRTRYAVRAYCHYWDDFDHEQLHQLKTAARGQGVETEARKTFQAFFDLKMQDILNADESRLFFMKCIEMDAPRQSGKFHASPCSCCGEYTKDELLERQEGSSVCIECFSR